MTNKTREELLRKVFFDYKNFPYGFSRSGDFSIKEADALSRYGSIFSALAHGTLQPETEDEKHFLAVMHEECEPNSIQERAWLRYIKRINRPKVGSMHRGKVEDLAESSGDDDDADLDDDMPTTTAVEID